MCVLKRDHHCFFTANCIGFFNQRYFIVFTFYVALGMILSILITSAYFYSSLPHTTWLHISRYVAPIAIALWLNGLLSFTHLLLIIQCNLSVIVVGCAVGFYGWQFCIVLSGQTSYEASHGICRYKLGSVSENLRCVFGPYWAANFLLPLRTLPDGDGFFWKTAKSCKGN